MFCKECGAQIKEGAIYCEACGAVAPVVDEAERSEGTEGQQFGFEYCKKCQTRLVDKSENKDSVLCKQCREELIRYPIPKWIWLVGASILVLLALSMFTFPQNLKNYRIVEGAEIRANKGYVYSTLNALNNIAMEDPETNKVAIKIVDVAMQHGYYDFAAYALDNYLVGEDVTETEYDRLSAYSDKLDQYYNTYDAYDNMYAQISQDESGVEEAYQEIIGQLEELLGDTYYDQPTIYYYMGYTEQDDVKRREYFETCYEMDPTYTDAASQAANSYRRAGDLENAQKLLESAYREDRESASVLRSYAVLEMLSGNTKRGLALAEEAYQQNPDEYYVADTYIMATAVNGDIEGAKTMREGFESEGYEFDDELTQYLNGECTLEDYYMEITKED